MLALKKIRPAFARKIQPGLKSTQSQGKGSKIEQNPKMEGNYGKSFRFNLAQFWRVLSKRSEMGKILKFGKKRATRYKGLCKHCNNRRTCELPYKNWIMEQCAWKSPSHRMLKSVAKIVEAIS
jgi:hypothetical protein